MENNAPLLNDAVDRLQSIDGSEENSSECSSIEPFARERAYTWHAGNAYKQDVQQDEAENSNSQQGSTEQDIGLEGDDDELDDRPSVLPRKNVTRRNAWGNQSYADLILRAIESYPEQRATLSMIYDWMVRNVAYFRDKADSNSSAGWKNSIRHNLSLQPRFMRVPNEGSGKSSWWVVNPESNSRLLKIPPRRRAFTLDSKTYEKRKARLRCKPDDATLSTPVGSLNSIADQQDSEEFAAGLSSSMAAPNMNYRSRAHSNASSIGRLSPIAATTEDENLLEGLSGRVGSRPGDWMNTDYDRHPAGGEMDEISDHLRLLNPSTGYEARTNSSQLASRSVSFGLPGDFQASPQLINNACVVSSQEADGSRGINRLRAFLTDPATQSLLSSNPQLLAKVQRMILDKRRRMMESSANAGSSFSSGSTSFGVNQQLMTGGGLTSTGRGHLQTETQYHDAGLDQYLSADIGQALLTDQNMTLTDFGIETLPSLESHGLTSTEFM